MEPTKPSRLRKRLMSQERITSADSRPGEIDIADGAIIAYSSEEAAHPVEHLIDGVGGPGGTYWASSRPNTTERIVLEFDHPERISCLVYEVEECSQERTQEVRVEVSTDRGRSYHQVLAQDYTFSPHGATFQHEELRLELQSITHLRLTIVPNKSGAGVASLTTLRLFA
jgi:F5/8 type C domain